MSTQITRLKKRYLQFPDDIPLALPENSLLDPVDLHFLVYIPWHDSYLNFVPSEYQEFFRRSLSLLSVRTIDVHTAVCFQFLNEFVQKAGVGGKPINRDLLSYALLLHDSGWSQMTEEEIATSLGVTGLALTDKAMGPKKKHAVLGEQIARRVLHESQSTLNFSNQDIDLICKAIRYHDEPETVAGAGNAMPIEVQLLVDLDHIWSFTHFNFWQDTLRKEISPRAYLENLNRDLSTYFVTSIGKEKAMEMLNEREKEVELAGL